jgi:hypothetical protein
VRSSRTAAAHCPHNKITKGATLMIRKNHSRSVARAKATYKKLYMKGVKEKHMDNNTKQKFDVKMCKEQRSEMLEENSPPSLVYWLFVERHFYASRLV